MEHPSFRATLMMYVAFDFLSSSAFTVEITFSLNKYIKPVHVERHNHQQYREKSCKVISISGKVQK